MLIGYCALKTAICKEDVSLYYLQVSRYSFFSVYSQDVNRYCVLGRGLNDPRVSSTWA